MNQKSLVGKNSKITIQQFLQLFESEMQNAKYLTLTH